MTNVAKSICLFAAGYRTWNRIPDIRRMKTRVAPDTKNHYGPYPPRRMPVAATDGRDLSGLSRRLEFLGPTKPYGRRFRTYTTAISRVRRESTILSSSGYVFATIKEHVSLTTTSRLNKCLLSALRKRVYPEKR